MFSHSNNNQNNLIAYEQAVSEAAAKGSVQIIGCYLQESLDKMQFSQIASILNAHQCDIILNTGMELRKIGPHIILDAILERMEDIVSKDSERLIMQAMKVVCKINEETIISNPPLFQEKLEKLLVNPSKRILDSMSKKIKEILSITIVAVAINCYFFTCPQ